MKDNYCFYFQNGMDSFKHDCICHCRLICKTVSFWVLQIETEQVKWNNESATWNFEVV